MRTGLIALSILTAGMNLSAEAGESGNDIREICQVAARGPKTDLELAKASYCQGFVKAIIFIGRRLDEPSSFCPPNGITVAQAINVYLKYLNENPDQTHQAAEDLAIRAFWTAWRCK